MERAERFLAEGRRADAVLELRNALERDPELLEANLRLAELALQSGHYEAAVSHVKNAYRLAPDDTEVALNLASVLQLEHPDRAKVLIDEVIAREPENFAGYLARVDLELTQGRTERALMAARKASELAPDEPAVHFKYGQAIQGKLRTLELGGAPVDEELQKAAVRAFERYIQKAGPQPWNAQIEQARVMATMQGQLRETSALYRLAIERMIREGASDADRLRGAARSAEFARVSRDDDLLDWSLSRLLDVRARNFDAWESLLAVRKRRGHSPEDVISELVSQLPLDPRAHIEYARYLISVGRFYDALAYLDEKAQHPDIDAPPLLGAIANTQLAAQLSQDAERTIERLEREYPNHPRTILERAQFDLRSGKLETALAALRKLVETDDSQDAYRLLAHAEEQRGRLGAALRAISQSIEKSSRFAYAEQRVKSRLLAELGHCRLVIQTLLEIRKRTLLSSSETVRLAHCRYETGREALGRYLLEEELDRPRRPSPATVLEYARREAGKEGTKGRAYKELERLLAHHPHHWQAIDLLTRLDMGEERITHALTRLDAAIGKPSEPPPAQILRLRAQVRMAAGQDAGALRDVEAALDAEPRLPEALELLSSLYVREGRVEEAVAAFQRAENAGGLDSERLILLGRLQRMGGREDLALQRFEQALAEKSNGPILKNDVAFLLAKRGRDLDRALQLATEATEELENNPNAVDTLGYVYLQSGDASTALSHFEDAVKRAEKPAPTFYYHLGLALRSLDRDKEAVRAFETALGTNERFPEAADAQRALEETRSTGAS
jgi:tetratricopeptide (TPR) repeat protein